MRYRCFIYDEEDRLDAGLRRLFADFPRRADEASRAQTAAPDDERADGRAGTPCRGPSPAPQMW